MKYSVSVPFYCSVLVQVEADSVEDALHKAADQTSGSLCHDCSRKVVMGEADYDHLDATRVEEQP